VHHEFTSPIALVAIYCTPLEFVLSDLMPLSIGLFLVRSHFFFAIMWIIAAVIGTQVIHTSPHSIHTSPHPHSQLSHNSPYSYLHPSSLHSLTSYPLCCPFTPFPLLNPSTPLPSPLSQVHHSGYRMPWAFGPDEQPGFHDFHHEKFKCNYGNLGILDALHGTSNLWFEHCARLQAHKKTK
jgi:hypothetical protein